MLTEHIEHTHTGFPLFSIVSNAVYILAGLLGMIFLDSGMGLSFAFNAFCIGSIILGATSWYYHATGSMLGRQLDNVGMSSVFGFGAAYYLSIVFPNVWTTLLAMVVLVLLPVVSTMRLDWRFNRPCLYADIATMLVCMVVMGLAHIQLTVLAVIAVIGLFALAAMFQGGEITRQEGGVLRSKLHGAWHLASGIGILFLIAYPMIYLTLTS